MTFDLGGLLSSFSDMTSGVLVVLGLLLLLVVGLWSGFQVLATLQGSGPPAAARVRRVLGPGGATNRPVPGVTPSAGGTGFLEGLLSWFSSFFSRLVDGVRRLLRL